MGTPSTSPSRHLSSSRRTGRWRWCSCRPWRRPSPPSSGSTTTSSARPATSGCPSPSRRSRGRFSSQPCLHSTGPFCHPEYYHDTGYSANTGVLGDTVTMINFIPQPKPPPPPQPHLCLYLFATENFHFLNRSGSFESRSRLAVKLLPQSFPAPFCHNSL